MKKKALLILISIVISSCNKTYKDEKNISDKQIDSLSLNNETVNSDTEPKTKNWYDDLIADYVKNSDNELIRISVKNKENVEWLLDRTEKTDSTNYYIFQIGQDVSEKDGSDLRFSTDGWIYVDSISKKIYEYDLPNESLMLWKNKHNR
ncbi:hypothetical protein [Flavobacterium muglaense]|uniref:Lipoprotein n=1 Tax=Flavobacterium muglaense TaxID=2764716 RepID=A0A923N2M3_9FLAO|nr:hypothetical protein [Flavobacterium muglaense]MBC5839690.1 hypothetical protein [Flavobacterium muglaense]MBC5846216.1 hypothetical protein [Flavobacterium muglaense]